VQASRASRACNASERDVCVCLSPLHFAIGVVVGEEGPEPPEEDGLRADLAPVAASL